MKQYLVIIKDKETSDNRFVSCKGERELSDLLLHIDKDKFEIEDIGIDNITQKIEQVEKFLKKEPGLETG